MRTSHIHVYLVHTSTLLGQKASLGMGHINRGCYLPRFGSVGSLWGNRSWIEPKKRLTAQDLMSL